MRPNSTPARSATTTTATTTAATTARRRALKRIARGSHDECDVVVTADRTIRPRGDELRNCARALLRAIEQMFQTGKAVYPIERTLLTTGILDAALHSLAAKSKQLDTPELAVAYQPVDWPFPQGKLWRYP